MTAALPPNIEAPPSLIALMRDVWTWSPTFRRQCARIAAARAGHVLIEIRKPHSVEIRAASVITHGDAGAWVARVEVYIDTDLVEMIAHEIEHVIEQIDGVDLPRMAQQGLEGVTAGGFGEHFETARAVATGKRVAHEYAGRQRLAS